MHHFPLVPSRRERAAAALRRWVAAPLRVRRALPVLIGLVVAVIALAVPVVSSAVGSPVALESSTSAGAGATGDSPVVMGVDGTAVPAGTGGSAAPADSATPADPAAPADSAAPAGGITQQPTAGAAPSGAAQSGAGSAATTPGGSTPAGTTTSTLAGSGTSSSPSSSSSSASSSSSPSASSPSASSSSPETPSAVAVPAVVPGAGAAVLALVNSARIHHGCDALAAEPDLAGTAATDSLRMATSGALGSTGLVGTGSPDAVGIVDGWLADAGDGARLLDCGLTSAGAAAATGSGSTWWTLLLG